MKKNYVNLIKIVLEKKPKLSQKKNDYELESLPT